MTLILSAQGRDSIWLVADRRISFRDRPPNDDARKVMILETTDGTAILGYAGLGSTANGTEPADWMNAVLRGRYQLTLEQSLGIIADALKREFPEHLKQLRVCGVASHDIVVPAIINDEVRLYTIGLAIVPGKSEPDFIYTRHVGGNKRPDIPSAKWWAKPGCVTGSGAYHLIKKGGRLPRDFLRIVTAYDDGKISAETVAQYFAQINYEVLQATENGTVGSRCIVAWRQKRNTSHKSNAGHLSFNGVTKEQQMPSVPTIGSGLDINAIVAATFPIAREQFEAGTLSEGLDIEKIKAAIALIPDTPDEKLR